MSTINLSKKTIKVIYEGKEYKVAKPSTRQLDEYSKSEKKDVASIVDFLDMLGFPKEVSWELDAESLRDLLSLIIPKFEEKKS